MLDQLLGKELPELNTNVELEEESSFHFLLGLLAVLVIAFCVQKLIK